MKEFQILVKRNTKLFFKDKGLFFTSLITPLILLVLYATFLSNVYKSSFESVINGMGLSIDKDILNGLASGQLMSSLLAVSCVTVSFCSNMLMVQDKISGAYNDMLITPSKRSLRALAYYVSTSLSTLLICFIALGACLIYVGATGWYLTIGDVLLLVLDIFLLTMFGTALSSIINHFLSSQGQISAVGSIVSSCYGFICGAYMPLASFSEGLRSVLMFLPGTYGTSLVRNHSINGVLREMESQGYSTDLIDGLKTVVDCKLEFFGSEVKVWVMYLVLCLTVATLIGAYVLINVLSNRKKKIK
jgi:multidrug/hemolysin transport system permease protein